MALTVENCRPRPDEARPGRAFGSAIGATEVSVHRSRSLATENRRPFKGFSMVFQWFFIIFQANPGLFEACIAIFSLDYVFRISTAHTVPAAELGVQYVDEKEVSPSKATFRRSR